MYWAEIDSIISLRWPTLQCDLYLLFAKAALTHVKSFSGNSYLTDLICAQESLHLSLFTAALDGCLAPKTGSKIETSAQNTKM